MRKGIKSITFLWFLLWVLVFGIMQAPVLSHAGKTTKITMVQLEEKMLSHTTNTLEYQYGKINSKKKRDWKLAKKLPIYATKLKISQKGWYTFCLTNTKGKKDLYRIKCKKKTYVFKKNRTLAIKPGDYYLVSRTNVKQALEVKEGALWENAGIVWGEKRDAGNSIWQLEPVGGRKFRLKNKNSGLYLTENLVQKKLALHDKTMVFEAIRAGGKYYYMKSTVTKKFLQVTEQGLIWQKKKKHKSFQYKLVKNAKSTSLIEIENETYPTAIEFGNYFILRGNVKSRYMINSLQAIIRNSAGENVIVATVTPKAFSYDLKGIDAQVSFGTLPVGQYSYIVSATDTQGNTVPLINRKFHIFIPESVGAKLLPYDVSLIHKIGQQSIGTELEKKACASYALAYCQAILYKTTPSPHSYWLNEAGGDVSCVWSRGNYKGGNYYNTELGVLQAAYLQLSQRKPCILHVTGNTAQHWITLVGYKDVTSVSELTTANFIAIDPWDAKLITVSDKYQVKNTYRLAICTD